MCYNQICVTFSKYILVSTISNGKVLQCLSPPLSLTTRLQGWPGKWRLVICRVCPGKDKMKLFSSIQGLDLDSIWKGRLHNLHLIMKYQLETSMENVMVMLICLCFLFCSCLCLSSYFCPC